MQQRVSIRTLSCLHAAAANTSGRQAFARIAGRRFLPVCARAIQIRLQSGASLFYTTRVFPTAAVGTDAGWRYQYPVHEARDPWPPHQP